MHWLPTTIRSAGATDRPSSWTETGVPASTASACASMARKPSAWLKAVTAPDPFDSG